ncbi:MAG: helix-turn-helix domain-containing protein [Oscillospiraceae bacterium]|jgi:transcriptional regulator with XRE-family HTH domain|nr:helix-turn-helix domain-containing protein [Oscillospiraceae bacterium]
MKLKEFRKQNNYTQESIAEFLSITTASYQRYEAGTRQPSIGTLHRLCDLYHCDMDELTGRLKNESAIETKAKEKDVPITIGNLRETLHEILSTEFASKLLAPVIEKHKGDCPGFRKANNNADRD